MPDKPKITLVRTKGVIDRMAIGGTTVFLHGCLLSEMYDGQCANITITPLTADIEIVDAPASQGVKA